MKTIYSKISILLILIFVNCSPRLNYFGKYYSPTEKVSLYFDINDIKEEYMVIGLLNFKYEPSVFTQEENYISNLVIKKAQKIGADGVLVTKFSNESENELTEDILSKEKNLTSVNNVLIDAKFLKFKK